MNKTNNSLKKIFLTGAVMLMGILFFVSGKYINVNAQQKSKIIVSPPKNEIKVEPGEQTQIRVKFYNAGDSLISGNLKVADFIVIDNSGTPEFLDKTGSVRYSAASWIQLPYDRISIPTDESVELLIPISVPKDALPGGHYFAVYMETTPGVGQQTSQKQASAVISNAVASLTYITVAGDININAGINKLKAPQFLEYGPIPVETEIKNTGDIHIRPKGYISAINFLNNVEDQSLIKEVNIFPERSRIYKNELGGKWMFGRYKLTAKISYNNGRFIERSIYVWVMPWKIIAVTLLSILILFIIFMKIFKSSQNRVETLENQLSKEEEELQELKEMLKKKEE